jgi:ribokinase
VLVVNEVEAQALSPFDGDRLAQARSLRSLGPRTVVITLGAEGAVVSGDAYDAPVPAFAVHAVDSVGAGDAFCGGFAVGLANGDELAPALRFASAAGAIAVTRPGAASSLPDRIEVENLLGFGTFSRP